jgi:hypothetical protein
MDEAIYELSEVATNVALFARVNNSIGNDDTAVFGDKNKPFKTVTEVLNRLSAGINVDIFIEGEVELGGRWTLSNNIIIFMAYGEGTPDPINNNAQLNLNGDFSMNLRDNSILTFMIDTKWNITTASGTFGAGEGSSILFLNHRVHDFTNGPSSKIYSNNGRGAIAEFIALTAPIMIYGGNSSLTTTSTNFIDSSLGTNPNLFSISAAPIVLRSTNMKFNGTADTDHSMITARFRGMKEHSSIAGYVYNVSAGFQIPTGSIIPRTATEEQAAQDAMKRVAFGVA